MRKSPSPLPPGHESVWDYPRPPRIEEVKVSLRVEFCGECIAETQKGMRVLETSHPPVYYFPPTDVRVEMLRLTNHRTWCEWKGEARYFTIQAWNKKATNAAWFYPDPSKSAAVLQNYVAFYPSLVDACFVDGEKVKAQEGDFYGGWITSKIHGPFKGPPGTHGW